MPADKPLRAVIRLLVPAVGATPGMPKIFTTPVPVREAAPVLVMADWLAVPPKAVPMLVVVPLPRVKTPEPRASSPAVVGL